MEAKILVELVISTAVPVQTVPTVASLVLDPAKMGFVAREWERHASVRRLGPAAAEQASADPLELIVTLRHVNRDLGPVHLQVPVPSLFLHQRQSLCCAQPL